MAASELGWFPTWGSRVRVQEDAEGGYRPGQLGEVVGLPDPCRPDDDRYLIEFADGVALAIPRRWIVQP